MFSETETFKRIEEGIRQRRQAVRFAEAAKIEQARAVSLVAKKNSSAFDEVVDKVYYLTTNPDINASSLSLIVDAIYHHGEDVRWDVEQQAEDTVAKNAITNGGLLDPQTGEWFSLERGPIWFRDPKADETLAALAPLLEERAA